MGCCMKIFAFLICSIISIALLSPACTADNKPVAAAHPMVMSTRGFARTSVLNNSVGKEAITAYRFELPYGVAAGWRLPYLGFSEGNTGNIQLNGVLVTIDNAPDKRLEVTFAGKTTVIIAPNKVVESDPIAEAIAPGTVIWVWTLYRNEDAKGPLPYMTWGYVDNCDGCLVGDIGTLSTAKLGDMTVLTGKADPLPLNAGQRYLIRSFQPMFISGRPNPAFTGTLMSAGFIGDSINIATGDFGRVTPEDLFPTRGWNGRACAYDTPYLVFGQSGSNTGGFTSAQQSDLFKYIFGTGNGDAQVNCLFDGYGINEIRMEILNKPLDRIWRSHLTVAEIAQRLGLPYMHTTLTPMTDGWLFYDAKNGGDKAALFAAFVTERKAFNDQVRNESKNIPGCVGYIDWGEAVETDPVISNNMWQVGVNMDGIHPSTLGFQKMSIPAAKALLTMKKRLENPIKVACVGDSLTSGFKMTDPEKDAYPAQLGRMLGAGYVVKGFAVPGRTALRKANIPLWKEQLFQDAQDWHPDIVVICLGTNDCWPAIWQELKGDFSGDLRDMVKLFIALPSKPATFLCLPPPLFIANGEVQKKILADEVIPAIRQVATDTGSGIIDWDTTMRDKEALFMDDKVHPLPGGATEMARLVAESLRKVIR